MAICHERAVLLPKKPDQYRKVQEAQTTMLSQEDFVSPDSRYYVYSPSKNALEMFLYPLQCGRFLYEPGYRLIRESFDSFLLMYIRKGTMRLGTEGRVQEAGKGQFVLLDCYGRHAYSTDTGWDCLWCHFDGITARHWYRNIVSRVGNVFSLPDPQPVIGKLTSIYNIFDSAGLVREPLLSKYLTDILTSILLYAPADEKTDAHIGIAEKITAYISEHFTEALTVSQLASLAGLSDYHFIRIFKRQTGFTPHEYVLNTRMNMARYLLKNSELSVKDICFSTGFSCESVFCNAFKRKEGMTPTQYREHG